ncbi:alginate lyase family protein [Massilia yuzhufengensis]|uniref:Poly(Beta-D-mannuronate) lyase n=1 Tax=Massilia yuzhufengensis TaxID=1164594 RepID=A0A1I1G6X7_9BURK|nr:alginate lyase family protein [Massilia yuzhufengensis]SFC07529.1 poly(beta-D-mannuronate) lyase [Massilia yuzhufengensis]
MPCHHPISNSRFHGRISGIAAALLLALGQGSALACEAPPPPVRDIDANRYYTDARSSIIDPVLKARNEAAVKPVNDYLEVVARAADAWQRKQDPAEARCALGWLQAWADQGALLGKMTTNQSYYTRKWTLGGLALSYARVRAAAAPAQRQAIEAWFRSLADATIAHSDAHKGVRNNHYYWEGLAVTAVGAVTGDARYLAWGRKVFDDAMLQVQPDGALPLEMARAAKALHYHLYAAAPLVMMASILDVQHPALERLLRFSADGIQDPAVFERMAGVAQERPSRMPGWIAIHDRHAPQPLSSAAPPANNWDARMGGDRSLANPLEHLRGQPRG